MILTLCHDHASALTRRLSEEPVIVSLTTAIDERLAHLGGRVVVPSLKDGVTWPLDGSQGTHVHRVRSIYNKHVIIS